MRKEIDYTMQSFKLDFNKNNIIWSHEFKAMKITKVTISKKKLD
jgi:hypothetical protein